MALRFEVKVIWCITSSNACRCYFFNALNYGYAYVSALQAEYCLFALKRGKAPFSNVSAFQAVEGFGISCNPLVFINVFY